MQIKCAFRSFFAYSGGPPGKRKRYTSYSEEDKEKIDEYALENDNSAALKRVRVDFPELGESTIR